MTIDPPIVDSVRGMAPSIHAHSGSIEQERQLPEPLVRALVDAGVFRMLMPRSLGGEELDPASVCQVIEALAVEDGAVGWCAMIGACNSHFAGLLPQEGAAAVFADRDVVLAAVFRPTGTAVAVDGGFRVRGRWPFASGILHSQWVGGACRVMDEDRPRIGVSGAPVMKLLFVPRADAVVMDTWYSLGLRGTGSHDFEIHDVFVPASRGVWFTDPPSKQGALHSLPAVTLFAPMIASVSLGIARHALEIFKDLSRVKKPLWTQQALETSAVAQSQLGRAEALLRAGRAFLFESLDDAWATACRGSPLSWTQRGLLCLSATQAAAQALEAVEMVYRAGGASAIYVSTHLERCLRDIRTSSQHVQVMPINYELAAQLFLGADMTGTAWNRDNRGDAH
jgi:indole-3-acetate monooxygenase